MHCNSRILIGTTNASLVQLKRAVPNKHSNKNILVYFN